MMLLIIICDYVNASWENNVVWTKSAVKLSSTTYYRIAVSRVKILLETFSRAINHERRIKSCTAN